MYGIDKPLTPAVDIQQNTEHIIIHIILAMQENVLRESQFFQAPPE